VSNHIIKLIEKGENQTLDFKFEISDSKKIARTISAFANTDGGKLLVGVKDNGRIAGVRSEEEFYMIEGAASMYCKPPINFSVKNWQISGKTILEVDIQKSSTTHYAPDEQGKMQYYTRVDDKTLQVNSIFLRVKQLQKQKKPVILRYSKDEQAILDYLAENKDITLSKFCKIAHLTNKMAEEILVNLIVLNIIEQKLTETTAFYMLKK